MAAPPNSIVLAVSARICALAHPVASTPRFFTAPAAATENGCNWRFHKSRLAAARPLGATIAAEMAQHRTG